MVGALFSKPKVDPSLARTEKLLKAQQAADSAAALAKERKRQAAVNVLRSGGGGSRSLLFGGPLGEVTGGRSLLG